ncbi:IMPACT family protein [Peptoniphilaceae bacterium SGI.137]|nr:IMPACT family protein [Peptoniphilaceae bacterium]
MSYYSIQKEMQTEFVEKKSRFLGFTAPCSSEEEAEFYFSLWRQQEPQATHHCTCYIIGAEGIFQRYSDDGEPQGTAGIPMLEILRKKNLTNLCVMSVRYFGGIKLGASGLVRAYSRSCRETVEAAGIVEYVEFQRVWIEIPYTAFGAVDFELHKIEVHESRREFTDVVRLSLALRTDQVDEIQDTVLNLTSGTAVWTCGEGFLHPVDSNGRYLENEK